MSLVLSRVISIVVFILQKNTKKILEAFLRYYRIDSWIPDWRSISLLISWITILSVLVLVQSETDQGVHLLLFLLLCSYPRHSQATLAWTELGGPL